jgi:protease-4
MQYIGKALREFRDSGKPVYAVGSSYSQGQYYLTKFFRSSTIPVILRSSFA